MTIQKLTDYVRREEANDLAAVRAMADYLYEEKYRGKRYSKGEIITRESYDKRMGITALKNLIGQVSALIAPKRWKVWEISYQTHALLVRCLN